MHTSYQIERLKRNCDRLQERYSEICSENKSLNARLRRQQRKEEKKTREAELDLIREKARVEEEERQLVRTQYDKRRREEVSTVMSIQHPKALASRAEREGDQSLWTVAMSTILLRRG